MTQHFRQFYVDAPLHAGARITLPDGLQHRLRHVLRMQAGDVFHLFNGRDGLFEATLTDAKARQATLTTQTKAFSTLPTKTLLIGQPKREAWETILRMATELAVTHIIPLQTDYTQTGKLNPQRATLLMIEAAEQSERLCLPQLAKPLPLQAGVIAWHQSNPTQPLLWADEARPNTSTPSASAVLVGPEGGFSPAERTWLGAQPFIHPISLGPLVLRADTATAAALARIA